MEIHLVPRPNPQIRAVVCLVISILISVSTLPSTGRLTLCALSLVICGTYRITRIRGEWLTSRLIFAFIPATKRQCKLSAVMSIGTKYSADDPSMAILVGFGPLQYAIAHFFDLVIPSLTGPFELWLETAKGREFVVWQGFSQIDFERNLEILQNQTGGSIRTL